MKDNYERNLQHINNHWHPHANSERRLIRKTFITLLFFGFLESYLGIATNMNLFCDQSPLVLTDYANFQNKFKQRGIREGKLPIPNDNEGTLLDASDAQVLRNAGGQLYGLYRTRVNGLDAFLIHNVSGGDISLVFFNPITHQYVTSAVVGIGGQDRDYQAHIETVLAHLHGDENYDLVQLHWGDITDEGVYSCSVEGVGVKLWENNSYESQSVSNMHELKTKYFHYPCPHLPKAAATQGSVVINVRTPDIEKQHSIEFSIENHTADSICALVLHGYGGYCVANFSQLQLPAGWSIKRGGGSSTYMLSTHGACIPPKQKLEGFAFDEPHCSFDKGSWDVWNQKERRSTATAMKSEQREW